MAGELATEAALDPEALEGFHRKRSRSRSPAG